MHLRALIAASKSQLDLGTWQRGIIPREQWPSRTAKAKAYKYGLAYRWRILGFEASGYQCRTRLLLSEEKQIFRASFGVIRDGDVVILCDYEFHASEPGWHCHARCGLLDTVDAARIRFGARRIPEAGARHRRMSFSSGNLPLTPATALASVIKSFGLNKIGGMP